MLVAAGMIAIIAAGMYEGARLRDRLRVERLFDAARAAAYEAMLQYRPGVVAVGYGGTCGDGARVEWFGFPSALGYPDMSAVSDATADLVPGWLVHQCAFAGHPSEGARLDYIRVVGYTPGVVDEGKARIAAEEAARRIDPTARVTRLQVLANPPRVLVRVADTWHEAEAEFEPDEPFDNAYLDYWAYTTFLRAVNRYRWHPGIKMADTPLPTYDEYRARLAEAPRVDEAFLRAAARVATDLLAQ